MTNGGLVAIRSNRSPRTGSKNDPSRTSTRSPTSLRTALNRAMPSARWLTSVATTRPAVRGEVQRLHAAAGAEVEAVVDGSAQGELGQGGRGGADPEHVVGADLLRQSVQPGCEVADHPEGAVVGGVGPHVQPGGHLADGAVQDPLRDQPVDQVGQRGLGRVRGHRRLEEEQPGQRRERAVVGSGTAQRGRGLVAQQRRVRHLAEQLARRASTVKSAATSAARSRAGMSGEVSRIGSA